MICPIANSYGCLPLAPSTVMIGRIKDVAPVKHNKSRSVKSPSVNVNFSSARFIFDNWRGRLERIRPTEFTMDIRYGAFNPDDLVLALSDYQDSNKQHEYRIYAVARMSCKRDSISLEKLSPAQQRAGWDRRLGQCATSPQPDILDGFVEQPQSYFMEKLQKMYPTCRELEHAFPRIKNTSAAGNHLNWLGKLKEWLY